MYLLMYIHNNSNINHNLNSSRINNSNNHNSNSSRINNRNKLNSSIRINNNNFSNNNVTGLSVNDPFLFCFSREFRVGKAWESERVQSTRKKGKNFLRSNVTFVQKKQVLTFKNLQNASRQKDLSSVLRDVIKEWIPTPLS